MSAQSDQIVAQLMAAKATDTKRLILEVTANLVETTPVKTGFARASWIPSLGEPSTDTGGTPQAVTSETQDAGLTDVLAYTAGTAYVSNNVPYIERLNDGSSTQAPAAFIESATERAIQTIQESPTEIRL